MRGEEELFTSDGDPPGRGALFNGGNVPDGAWPAAAADMGPNNSSNNSFSAWRACTMAFSWLSHVLDWNYVDDPWWEGMADDQ